MLNLPPHCDSIRVFTDIMHNTIIICIGIPSCRPDRPQGQGQVVRPNDAQPSIAEGGRPRDTIGVAQACSPFDPFHASLPSPSCAVRGTGRAGDMKTWHYSLTSPIAIKSRGSSS